MVEEVPWCPTFTSERKQYFFKIKTNLKASNWHTLFTLLQFKLERGNQLIGREMILTRLC